MVVDHEAERCGFGCRRGFLAASAALGAALLLPVAARSASVRLVEGSVNVNGKPATRTTRVHGGDLIETAEDGKLVFVVGQDAFLLRERSRLRLETPAAKSKAATPNIRLESGALVAVFGKGRRMIETTTAAATIRGTGVYLEASPDQTYFCTCYGEVELRDKTGAARKLVVAGYHTPNVIYAHPVGGLLLVPASVKDHTDAELIMLDGLVGRSSPLARRQQNEETKEKSTQSEASSHEPPDVVTAPESQAQTKRRAKKAPSPPTEPDPITSPPVEPAPDTVVEPPLKANPPPAPEPELRLPPARLE